MYRVTEIKTSRQQQCGPIYNSRQGRSQDFQREVLLPCENLLFMRSVTMVCCEIVHGSYRYPCMQLEATRKLAVLLQSSTLVTESKVASIVIF